MSIGKTSTPRIGTAVILSRIMPEWYRASRLRLTALSDPFVRGAMFMLHIEGHDGIEMELETSHVEQTEDVKRFL